MLSVVASEGEVRKGDFKGVRRDLTVLCLPPVASHFRGFKKVLILLLFYLFNFSLSHVVFDMMNEGDEKEGAETLSEKAVL